MTNNFCRSASVWLLVVLLNMSMTFGHVVLNYPTPRKFDLDYLENSTSPEPCGMMKGTLNNYCFLSHILTNDTLVPGSIQLNIIIDNN